MRIESNCQTGEIKYFDDADNEIDPPVLEEGNEPLPADELEAEYLSNDKLAVAINRRYRCSHHGRLHGPVGRLPLLRPPYHLALVHQICGHARR